jgi:hypothetical protein
MRGFLLSIRLTYGSEGAIIDVSLVESGSVARYLPLLCTKKYTIRKNMHSFSVQIPEGWEVGETLHKVAENCDRFKGNTREGTFEKMGVTGEYNITGRTCYIRITDKPWLADYDTIEKKIREFFS